MASTSQRLQSLQGPKAKRTNTFPTSSWASSVHPAKTLPKARAAPPFPDWTLPPELLKPRVQLALVSTLVVLLIVTAALAWRWRRALRRKKERHDRKALVRRISKRTVSALLRALQEPSVAPQATCALTSSPRHTHSLRCVASLRAARRRMALVRCDADPSRTSDFYPTHHLDRAVLGCGLGYPCYEEEEDTDVSDSIGESQAHLVGSSRRDASEISLPLRSVTNSANSFLTRNDRSPLRPSSSPDHKRDSYTEASSSSFEFVELPEEERPHSSPTLLGLCPMEKIRHKTEESSSTTLDLILSESEWAQLNPVLSENTDIEVMIDSGLECQSRSRSSSPIVRQVCHTSAGGDLPLPVTLVLDDTLSTEKRMTPSTPTTKPSGPHAAGDLASAAKSPEDEDVHAIHMANRLPCDWWSARREREAGARAGTRRLMTPLVPYRLLPPFIVGAYNFPLSLVNAAAMVPTDPLPSSRGVGDDGIALPEIVPAELRGWWQRRGEFEREASACVARTGGPLRNSVAVARHLLWQLRVLKRWRARRIHRDGEGDVSQQAQERFLEVSMCFLLALLALLARVDRICPADLNSFVAMASEASDSASDDDPAQPSRGHAATPTPTPASDSTPSTPVASGNDVTA